MDKQIILITTKGCKGCEIQRRNIRQAIKDSNLDIDLEIKDFESLSKHEVQDWRNKRVFLKDFPTTIFIKHDVITFHTTGSLPSIVNLRYIDLYLKVKV